MKRRCISDEQIVAVVKQAGRTGEPPIATAIVSGESKAELVKRATSASAKKCLLGSALTPLRRFGLSKSGSGEGLYPAIATSA
jgi:hypothetical protein